jgi:hypothetical protein
MRLPLISVSRRPPGDFGMEKQAWARELKELIDGVGRARQAGAELSEVLWREVVADDVRPQELPRSLASPLTLLREELANLERVAGEAFSRYSSVPTAKFWGGHQLTREDYYVLRAMGLDFGSAVEIGLTDVDDYTV